MDMGYNDWEAPGAYDMEPAIDDGQQEAEALQNGLAKFTPQQEMARSKNDQAIAWLQSAPGIPDEQRQREIARFASQNRSIRPMPVPADKQPVPIPKQVAQSMYHDREGQFGPPGTLYERSPKNPQYWMPSAHQPAFDSGSPGSQFTHEGVGYSDANMPEMGMGQGSNPMLRAVKSRTVQDEQGHWWTLDPKGMPHPLKMQPVGDPNEFKREQAKAKMDQDHQKQLVDLYHKQLATQVKINPDLESLDHAAAWKQAEEDLHQLQSLSNPATSSYKKYLEDRFSEYDIDELESMRKKAAAASPEDERLISDAMDVKSGVQPRNGVPEGWSAPRQKPQFDSEVLSFVQKASKSQMGWWVNHSTSEDILTEKEFKKSYPGKDYEMYVKLRGFVKQNRDALPEIWTQLQHSPEIIPAGKQTPEPPEPDSVDAQAAALAKQAGENFAKIFPVPGQKEYDEFQKTWDSAAPGTILVCPDGKRRMKPKHGGNT
jgi:hypothetical protein